MSNNWLNNIVSIVIPLPLIYALKNQRYGPSLMCKDIYYSFIFRAKNGKKLVIHRKSLCDEILHAIKSCFQKICKDTRKYLHVIANEK